MLITLDWSFWTKLVIFTSVAVSGFTSTTYTVPQEPSNIPSPVLKEQLRAFPSIRLSKTACRLTGHCSFFFSEHDDHCSPENGFATSLCPLSFSLSHYFWPLVCNVLSVSCLQCWAGEEGLCRSWKLWRKYNTINLLSLFFSFEKIQILTLFSSKEKSLWNQE